MSLAHAARAAVLVPSILLAPIVLASVPVAAQRVRLSAPLVSGGSVTGALLGADSIHAVYRADQDQNEVHELYAVALDAPSLAWKLSGELVTGGDVSAFHALSADAQHVVYLADQVSNDRDELFSVPLAGGAPVRLNGSLVANGDVWPDCSISPDSSRVVYRADQDVLDVDELYSVPIGGGTAVQLNGVLPAGGDVFGLVRTSPDSTRVVYTADQDVTDRAELYSAPLDGSAPPVKLHPPLAPGRGVNAALVAIDADSTRALFVGILGAPNVIELYSAPLDGSSPPVTLNAPLVPNGDVEGFVLGPGGRAFYFADLEIGLTEVFAGSRSTAAASRDACTLRASRSASSDPRRATACSTRPERGRASSS